jgi:hypothetical protein
LAKKNDPFSMVQDAYLMYKNYIVEGGPLEINVDSKLRERIKDSVTGLGISGNLFDIVRDIENEFKQVSDATIKMLDQHWDKWCKSPEALALRAARTALTSAPGFKPTTPDWTARPLSEKAAAAKDKYKPDTSLPAILGGGKEKKPKKDKEAKASPKLRAAADDEHSGTSSPKKTKKKNADADADTSSTGSTSGKSSASASLAMSSSMSRSGSRRSSLSTERVAAAAAASSPAAAAREAAAALSPEGAPKQRKKVKRVKPVAPSGPPPALPADAAAAAAAAAAAPDAAKVQTPIAAAAEDGVAPDAVELEQEFDVDEANADDGEDDSTVEDDADLRLVVGATAAPGVAFHDSRDQVSD